LDIEALKAAALATLAAVIIETFTILYVDYLLKSLSCFYGFYAFALS